MTKVLLILLCNLVFSSGLTFSVVSESHSNNQPKIIQIYSKTEPPELLRVEYYYEVGSIRKIENYKDSVLHDLLVEYDQMGRIQFKGYYEEGYFRGDTLKVFDDYGKMISEHAYVNGALNGTSYEYMRDGRLAVEENYINNTLNGERLTYHQNGSVMSKESFKNGYLEGSKYIYHSNGSIYFIGNYIDGLLNGNFLYSNMNQEIIFKGGSVDNKFHGVLKYYPMNNLILKDNIAKPWERVKADGVYSEYCGCYTAEYQHGDLKRE